MTSIGQAQEITKFPYRFDLIAICQGYNEKELKDALMDNVQNFLLELGTGFASHAKPLYNGLVHFSCYVFLGTLQHSAKS